MLKGAPGTSGAIVKNVWLCFLRGNFPSFTPMVSKTMEHNTVVLKKRAFEKTYNRFFSTFYQIALQFLNHEDDAKGIVQDAFIKLWEKDIELASETEVKNYLFIIVRNQCLNVLRERKKKFMDTDNPDALLTTINYRLLDETGEDILLYQELSERVQMAISQLSPQCMQVFKLSRFDELTNKEISEKMDISLKAVEANMTRALKKLRKELLPYLSGDMIKDKRSNLYSFLFSLLF